MKHRFARTGIMFFAAILAALSPAAAAETKKGVYFGLNAGGGPVASAGQSWLAGIEAGVRLSARISLAVDVSIGMLTLQHESATETTLARDTQEWTTVPVTLSVLYAESLGERATAYLGAGIGWHSLSRDSTSLTGIGGPLQTETQRSTFGALAPQIVMGLEFGLARSISLTGTMKYAFGTSVRKDVISGLNLSQDINFGGASMVIGLRFGPF